MVTQHQYQAQTKAYIRAAITITLIVGWNCAVLTGFLLYLGPSGPRFGWLVIFFLTKGEWKDVLFWIGTLATLITLIHLVVDWLVLQGCIRCLVSVDHPLGICE
ncbi:MAG: DUF4405 domain-containing protein [Chloroflexi bacterium]|nr:DUF4405 domain-containing protein [Chloroflexota bacterium]